MTEIEEIKKFEKEIWKDINGYENYEVSNLGNIRSKQTHKLISKTYRTGYTRVSITSNKKRNTISVHKLVAETFIPNNDISKTQINHINGIKDDNRVCNLEWISQSENIKHAQNTGLMKSPNKPVAQYDLNGNFIKEWISGTEAERVLGIKTKSISSAINKNRTSGGFKWKLIDEEKNYDYHGEIWKQFNDTKYKISNFGRVKDIRNKIKSQRLRDNRYEVSLRINNKDCNFQTSRLVALIFLENPNNLDQVDHIDKNSLNNHVTNLRWISCKDNIRHSFGKIIYQYDLNNILIKKWNCMIDIKTELNIDTSQISDVCNGKQKTSHGFIWKFN
jgi:hypothetical protein